MMTENKESMKANGTENGKDSRKKGRKGKNHLPVIAAAMLLLTVVLSLSFGGVFGDVIINDLDQAAGTEEDTALSDDVTYDTEDDYDDGYVQMGSDGNVFTDEEIFVLRLAEEINGERVTALKENCLRGSSRISSVIIPECVTEIGDNAFADCKNLETIIFEGRKDLSGMKLGDNCFGDAELIFESGGETEEGTPSETEDIYDEEASAGTEEPAVTEPAEETETVSETAGEAGNGADAENAVSEEDGTGASDESGAAEETEAAEEDVTETSHETGAAAESGTGEPAGSEAGAASEASAPTASETRTPE